MPEPKLQSLLLPGLRIYCCMEKLHWFLCSPRLLALT